MRAESREKFFLMPDDLFKLDLCAGEIAVYAYLRWGINNHTFQCWPSYTTIGKAVKFSKNTVKKYVDSLTEKGLIVTEHTSRFTDDGLKFNGNLCYTLPPFRIAVQNFYDRQMAELERTSERSKVQKALISQAEADADAKTAS